MIAIVDYGMGNLRSIQNMLNHLSAPSIITSEAAEIESAEHIILPGVGAFDNAMANIERLGLRPILREAVDKSIPLLGICLGMQLLARRSEEGKLPGLGLIEADVVRFDFSRLEKKLNVPHMGWNSVCVHRDNRLLPPGSVEESLEGGRPMPTSAAKLLPNIGRCGHPPCTCNLQPGFSTGPAAESHRFYFVHSFYLRCDRPEDVIGVTEYGYPFASVVGRDNIYGTQFHPEKSHRFGINLLANFVRIGQYAYHACDALSAG